MKKIILAVSAAALALSAGMAVAQRPDRTASVSRADVSARTDARFAQIDKDRNGVITEAEMKAGHGMRGDRRKMQGMMSGGPDRGKHHGARGGAPGGRSRMDANNDGQVSRAEFGAQALQRFARSDTDRNGVVTGEERQKAHGARGAQRAH